MSEAIKNTPSSKLYMIYFKRPKFKAILKQFLGETEKQNIDNTTTIFMQQISFANGNRRK